jgi:hypothetical protein
MKRGNSNSELQSPPRVGGWTPVRWLSPLLLALAMGGVVAGAVVAQTNPDWIDWDGTSPASISGDAEAFRAWQPAIAAGPPGRMMTAWSDVSQSAGAKRDIHLVLSADNGRTWSTPRAITTALHSALPDAIIVGDRHFVAWVDQLVEGGQMAALYEAEVAETGDVVAVRSIPIPAALQSQSSSTRPRLAVSEDRLHVVFNAGDPSSILYAVRPLTATAWPTATIVTSTAAFGSWFPSLIVDPDGETLHLVWQDLAPGERTVRYMRWNASGTDLCTLSPVTTTENTQWIHPSIAADSGGNLHVVWGEEVGTGSADKLDQYVRYTRYDADSGSWTPSERVFSEHVKVNADDPRDVSPSLALKEEDGETEICVAWHGFREGSAVLAEEVLLSCSNDDGETWSEPRNMSRSFGYDPGETDVSIIPAITFDMMGQLHGVWQERTGLVSLVPYYEIYHTRGVHVVFLPLVVRS